MTNEAETVTITQTAPDGTETTIEITQTKPEDANSDDQTLVEEVIDAIFDTDLDSSDSPIEEADTTSETTDTDYTLTESEPSDVIFETSEPVSADESSQPLFADDSRDSVSFDPAEESQLVSNDSEVSVPVDYDPSSEQVPFVAAPTDVSPISDTSETSDSSATDVHEAVENDVLEAHAEAARDAQAEADEFVAAGDYEAAAEAREVAENESWEAGDSSILEGSSSTELDSAAQQQDFAEYHKDLQEEYTAQGDYEAAQAEADKVVENTGNADYYASGDDHTNQSRNEEYQLGNAVSEEGNADYYAKGAEEYAAQGDFDSAAEWAETAGEHQDAADYHAESTTDGSLYDATSAVESGGSYDATDYSAATDYSSYDTAATDYSAVDTSTTDYSTE